MIEASRFFGRERVTLFHGSAHIVKNPEYGQGNPYNDYGQGFYTTEFKELALEWACPRQEDGWANEYVLDVRGLSVVDLSGDEFGVLNWMAVLLTNRRIALGVGIAAEARDYLLAEHGVDLSSADIVYGYRADDSYFHIARSFLNNRIPVEVLEQSLLLGKLGYQVAIVSKRAFGKLAWVSAEPASGSIWNPRRLKRDADARKAALQLEKKAIAGRDGTYVVDLMRGRG